MSVLMASLTLLLNVTPVAASDNSTIINFSDGTVPISKSLIELQKQNAGINPSNCEDNTSVADLKIFTLVPDGNAQPTREEWVAIGTNTTFYSGDHGQEGGSTWGLATRDTSYDIAARKHFVSLWTYGIGNAEGGATTGESFWITGAGSQLAYIDISGWAGVNLLGGAMGGSASWEVKAELWDIVGTSTLIGTTQIFSAQSTNNQLVVDGGNFSVSILASLQADHCYIMRLFTTGWASQYGPQISSMEAGTSSLYSTWTSINIRWQ
ncbi:MAG: hypothetical protein PHY25_04665 [Dehalococcoidales bacterium]|jgi:hypothetical protein|nr:hypothetical protein [Dehalococcoidales bacterium]